MSSRSARGSEPRFGHWGWLLVLTTGLGLREAPGMYRGCPMPRLSLGYNLPAHC